MRHLWSTEALELAGNPRVKPALSAASRLTALTKKATKWTTAKKAMAFGTQVETT